MNKTFTTNSPEETKQIAIDLTANLKSSTVLALIGDLGAGKTQFIKGIAKAIGFNEDNISSPTFTIINEYIGKTKLNHIDLYRIDNLKDIDSLGLDDYFFENGITAVEWADKFKSIFPKNTIWINFEVMDDNKREITISDNQI